MAARDTVLVTGATGAVGRALVAELVDTDVQLRALSRDPAAIVPAGAQLVVGDFTDAESLDRAMAGADRVFLVTAGIHIAEHDFDAIKAARRAGVQHVVKLSALGVGRGGNDPITNWHRAGEQALRDSDLQWTMLRPTAFMTNTLEWAYSIRATGTVAAPSRTVAPQPSIRAMLLGSRRWHSGRTPTTKASTS